MFESAVLFETSIGTCGLAWSQAGLTRVQLPEATAAATATRLLRHGAERMPDSGLPAGIVSVIGALRDYLSGTRVMFSGVELDMRRLSPFDHAVYAALRDVPWDETVTYGELARRVGDPGAARAVGMAMGRNPWPVIVPCHRVLAAGKKPGGFSAHGGETTKRALLDREGVRFDGGQLALFE